MKARASSFAVVACVACVAGVTAASVARAAEKRASSEKDTFAPFDAGDQRDVVRQGTKGKARRAHPMVGDAAKVPGEGPPPPPLRRDPDVPEGVLDKKNPVNGGPNALGGDLSSNPLYLAALAYQNVITKIDGPRCTHLPTCSRFASQAVARHGVVGILMGLDRVIQPNESSPIRRLPEVDGYGGIRVYDPVDNYEFWHTERFTGFPPATKEVPLSLPPLRRVSACLPLPPTPSPRCGEGEAAQRERFAQNGLPSPQRGEGQGKRDESLVSEDRP